MATIKFLRLHRGYFVEQQSELERTQVATCRTSLGTVHVVKEPLLFCRGTNWESFITSPMGRMELQVVQTLPVA